MDLYSVPLGEELHMSGTADLRIDTKDDLFTSGEVLRKLYLSSFGVDSIAKFCLGILIGNPEQCTSHILRPYVSHSTWFDGILIVVCLGLMNVMLSMPISVAALTSLLHHPRGEAFIGTARNTVQPVFSVITVGESMIWFI